MGEQSPPLPNSTAVWYDGVYPEMLQDHVSEPNLKSKLRIGMLCSEILCVCVQVRKFTSASLLVVTGVKCREGDRKT